MRVIVTEKISVADRFGEALGLGVSRNHEPICGKSPVDNEEYIVTWTNGHLVDMSIPDKYGEQYKNHYDLNTLPFIPDEFLYEIKENAKGQFKAVDKILKSMKKGDVYYNAGDSGREGEYIQRLILQMSKINKDVLMKRIWIDSQTDAEILRGIKEAKPVSEYDSISDAAYLRAKEDYLLGMNFSRLMRCAYANGRDFKDNNISVNIGRVKMCVLGMVIRREAEIKDFKESTYYKIEADTGFKATWKVSETSQYYNSPLMFNYKGFKERKDAETFINKLKETPFLKVTKANHTPYKKQAPTLFNLAELQAECTNIFKISPDKTLEAAQSLYEKKLTTYPRTDARVLSTAIAEEINKNIDGINSVTDKYKEIITSLNKSGTDPVKEIMSSKRFVDDLKITDHYAIIPTGEGSLKGLSELEENIYDLICKRFLAIFLNPAEYIKHEITFMHYSGEEFICTLTELTEEGYLLLYDDKNDEDKTDDAAIIKKAEGLREEDIINAEFSISEGKTTPPKRYTSGSMIIAMENAGNLIEDAELRNRIKGSGIGTSATRAGVLKKLVDIRYLSLNEKTQVLSPHKNGEIIYSMVNESIPNLLYPDLTAQWEENLTAVSERKADKNKVLDEFKDYILRTVDDVKKHIKEKTATDLVCPECGSNLADSGKLYKCGCGFIFFKNTRGKDLSEDEIRKLLKGEIIHIKGLKTKDGKVYDGDLVLSDGKVKNVFKDVS